MLRTVLYCTVHIVCCTTVVQQEAYQIVWDSARARTHESVPETIATTLTALNVNI